MCATRVGLTVAYAGISGTHAGSLPPLRELYLRWVLRVVVECLVSDRNRTRLAVCPDLLKGVTLHHVLGL